MFELVRNNIQSMSYEDYLHLFGVDIQCKSLDDLYLTTATHTIDGEYIEDEFDDDVLITEEYWDYPIEEFNDIIKEHLTVGEAGSLYCNLVKIDNRYFETPKAYKVWCQIGDEDYD